MFLEFIILGFAFSIVFSFIALANIRKGKIAKNIFYIFIVLLIGFSMSGIFIVEKMNDDKLWKKKVKVSIDSNKKSNDNKNDSTERLFICKGELA